MPAKIPAELLIEDLQLVAEKLGRAPLLSEYGNAGKYNPITIRKSFGTWDECIAAANLQKPPHHKTKWTDNDLQNELDRLTNLLGHSPSFTEVKTHGKIHPDTFTRRLDNRMFTGMTPESDDWCVDSVPDDVGHWIAGFTCGEGSFLVRETGAAAYRITVRLDDIDTLRLIAETLKLSDFEEAKFIYIYSNQKRRNKGEKAGDEARLAVSNKHIQHTRIISLFERFPVRGKKAMEFEIYKDVIKIACKKDFETPPRPRYNDAEKAFFADAAAKIQGLRKAPMSLK